MGGDAVTTAGSLSSWTDDGAREFAYDAGAERALAEAVERRWTVVSMKDDFATVF